MNTQLLHLFEVYGLLGEAPNEKPDLKNISTEELERMSDEAEEKEDYHMAYLYKQELEWRKLSPGEQSMASDLQKDFGIQFNGYTNAEDASMGYYFTDRNITRTTFVVKQLTPEALAKAFVFKLKQFRPNDWESLLSKMQSNIDPKAAEHLEVAAGNTVSA
jgi:hypothetical protein